MRHQTGMLILCIQSFDFRYDYQDNPLGDRRLGLDLQKECILLIC